MSLVCGPVNGVAEACKRSWQDVLPEYSTVEARVLCVGYVETGVERQLIY